jgi:hypothetical protein
MHAILEYYKEKPMVLSLPHGKEVETIEIFFSKNQIIDEFSQEHYFFLDVKGREKFTKFTDSMFEHYTIKEFHRHCKLFSIDGDVYVKLNYV